MRSRIDLPPQFADELAWESQPKSKPLLRYLFSPLAAAVLFLWRLIG